MTPVEKPKVQMPEALSIYYTLTKFNMTYTGAVGYVNQPHIHFMEMTICSNIVSEMEAKIMKRATQA